MTQATDTRLRSAAVQRAHELFEAEDRHMRLFAIALDAPDASPAAPAGAAERSDKPARLADLSGVAERDLLEVHDRLRAAQAQARRLAAADPTLQALNRRLHGSLPRQAGRAEEAEVFDVQARELSGPTDEAHEARQLEAGSGA